MSKRKSDSSAENDKVKRRRSEEGDAEIDLSQNPDFEVNEREAEVGIVESIYLKNFMCHSVLDFKFNSNVNFVIGRNGSGKSAVLTALQLGLGGKSQATSRGNSVKAFVKTGKQTAFIEVRLRNRGPDAFKPEKYGKSIIVQRRIRADGGTSYSMKNANGQLVSNKREELNHMLDQFNIQVDNPVSILTQDTSRNFLHSKSPLDKYKFFLKATQLENMKHDYVQATGHKKQAKELLDFKENVMPTLEKEVRDWEERFKAIDAIKDAKTKVKNMKSEMAWAYVNVARREMEGAERNLRTEENRTPKFESKRDHWKNELNQLEQKRKATEEKLKDLGKEVKDLEPKHKELKKLRDEKKKQWKSVSVEERKVSSDLASMNEERKDIKNRIAELRNQLAEEDIQARRREREEKIAALEERQKDLEATRRSTEHEQEQFGQAVRKYKQDQYNVSDEITTLNNEIQSKQRMIRQMEGARKDRMKRYGEHIPALLAKINEAYQRGKFKQKPRGPIGAHMTVRDPRWALAIEQCLKGLPFAFCVDNIEDMKIFQALSNQVGGRKPTVICSKFLDRIHDVSPHSARCQYPTVLDMLSIEDPVVANALIDQRSVENVILIENTKEARTFMSADRTPPNVREAFAMNGDQMYCFPTYRYYSARTAKAKLLTADIEEDISSSKEEIVRLQHQVQDLKQHSNTLENSTRENQKNERTCQTRVMKLKEQSNKIYNELNELHNIEDPAPVDVSALQEEVDRFTEKIDRLQVTKDALVQQNSSVKAEMDEAERAFHEIADRISNLANSSDPINEKFTLYQDRIQQCKKNLQHYETKLNEHMEKVEIAKKEFEKLTAEYESDVEKATIICPNRMDTEKTPPQLGKEIEQLLKQIQSEENRRGDSEEITRKYYETQEHYMQIKKEVSQFRNFLKELDKILKKRHSQYLQFKRMIALRTNTYFMVTLNSRNYHGKLDFNHDKESLDLLVQPHKHADESHKDVKALSGGERSFSTVCFILALWEAMESPFRCLDEFDVFMDMVNRRISMDLMMRIANEQLARQFIFLTPLDMSYVDIQHNVSVFRMPDPDRGAGVLPFGQRQDDEEDGN